MWKDKENDEKLQRFYTPPPKRSSRPHSQKRWMTENSKMDNIVPSGNSPYVKAKHVQLIEKDPNKAVALFWNAINAGDRVDSALKDMAVVMKQLDRSNEAIEAIKSFRHLCSSDSQESIDNVLLELYKSSGRLDEQIEVLQLKLKRVEVRNTFGGKRMRVARSQGKKIHVSIEREYVSLLGNLAWTYLLQNDYKSAEEYYRRALSIELDRNMQCNLAICLMRMNRITEAKFLLEVIRASGPEGQMDESYAKSFDRASKLLAEMEGQRDKFSFEGEKNHCRNVGCFPLNPHSKPFQPIRNRNKRVSDDQIDLKGDAYSKDSFVMSNNGSAGNTAAFDADFSCTRTYTPSLKLPGILKSPFTQPKNEPVNRVPRRLQFENPIGSVFHPTQNLNSKYLETDQEGGEYMMTAPIDSAQVRKVPDKTIPDVDNKGNFPPTETSSSKIEDRDSCSAFNGWVFSSFKCQKSWADLAEEDEQEMMHNILSQEKMQCQKKSSIQRY